MCRSRQDRLIMVVGTGVIGPCRLWVGLKCIIKNRRVGRVSIDEGGAGLGCVWKQVGWVKGACGRVGLVQNV